MSDRKFSFEILKTSTAPTSTLFRLVTDGGRWSEWAKPLIVQSHWVRQGDPAPGGIGAIRKLGMWPLFVQEETVEYEQDRRHVYRLIAPALPIKEYIAEVALTPNALGGTDLRWSGSFSEGVTKTGPALQVALSRAIQLLADRLIKAAEHQSSN